MSGQTHFLDSYIKGWDDTVEWSGDELAAIRSLLESISQHNGGRVEHDAELEEYQEQTYILYTIETALQKVMNLYASSIRLGERGYYYVSVEGVEPALDFLRPVEYIPRIDINRAAAEELADLPGIGPKTAGRLVDYRAEKGPFKDISEVLAVEGIDRADFDKFKYAVTAGPTEDTPGFLSPLLLAFKRKPTFARYLTLIKSSGGRFVLNEAFEAKDFKEAVLAEIKKVDDYIRRNRYPAFDKYWRKSAADIRAFHEQHRLVTRLEEQASTDIGGVTVIDDSQYLSFISKLIAAAGQRIRIIMFFMRFEDEEKYPTDAIFAALKAARERGVDIKVILDRDAEGEVFGSRVINEDAYNFFKDNGIDVTYDSEEELTHSKLVLVDDRHLVVGSHNWTAGSFFAYDDKSVYIDSEQAAAETARYFDRLWTEYTSESKDQYKRLRDLAGIGYSHALRLRGEGIHSTRDLLQMSGSAADREALSEKTAIAPDLILKWAHIADLMRIEGVHEERAYLLVEEMGIGGVSGLASQEPEGLHAKIGSIPFVPKPPLQKVSGWIEQAKNLDSLVQQ
jgi:competence ComEA-like helix-hairpin-helix protein